MAADIACVVCGKGRLHLQESERTTEIGGVEHKVPFRTHWCDACGSTQGLSEDLRFNARAMRQVRKKHSGLLTGEEVRACRKSLGLNQAEAAQLFGGGPVAFSKYENDEVTQSDAMDRLIWLVAKCPPLVSLLASYVHMELPDSAKVVVEKIQVKVGEEYFLAAEVSAAYIDHVLDGFGTPLSASNDKIYKSTTDSHSVDWKVA